jgi:hypothetical protein
MFSILVDSFVRPRLFFNSSPSEVYWAWCVGNTGGPITDLEWTLKPSLFSFETKSTHLYSYLDHINGRRETHFDIMAYFM